MRRAKALLKVELTTVHILDISLPPSSHSIIQSYAGDIATANIKMQLAYDVVQVTNRVLD